MKKILFAGLVLIAGVFVIRGSGYCATVGAPTETNTGGFSIGLERDYTFERDMENRDFQNVVPKAAADPVAGNLNEYGSVAYKIKDSGMTMIDAGYQLVKCLNIYAKLGVTDDGSRLAAPNSGTWSKSNFPPKPEDFGTYYNTTDRNESGNFAYGMGFKVLYPLEDSSSLGIDAQYLAHTNWYSKTASERVYDHNGALIPAYSTDTYTANAGSATVSEWHIAPFVTKSLGNFLCYAGAKYSGAQFRSETENLTLNSMNNVGIFLGTDIRVRETFFLQLEGQLIDENALSITGTVVLDQGAPEKAQAVKSEVVKNPDMIEYTVVEGDWVSKLARQYLGDKMRYDEIAKLNNIKSPDLIVPGQKIYIKK